jgi:hypothetical protein
LGELVTAAVTGLRLFVSVLANTFCALFLANHYYEKFKVFVSIRLRRLWGPVIWSRERCLFFFFFPLPLSLFLSTFEYQGGLIFDGTIGRFLEECKKPLRALDVVVPQDRGERRKERKKKKNSRDLRC